MKLYYVTWKVIFVTCFWMCWKAFHTLCLMHYFCFLLIYVIHLQITSSSEKKTMHNKSLFVLLCLSTLLLPNVHTYGCDDCQHSYIAVCCLVAHRCCQEAIANLLNTRSLPQCKSTSDNLVAQPRLVSILSYLFFQKIHFLFFFLSSF